MIRPIELEDARALTALYAANRDFLAPFEPDRGDAFFTEAGQRERIEQLIERRARDTGYGFVILDGAEIAGTAGLSNVVRWSFQNANLGYWIERARNGRGLATRAVAEALRVAFDELGLHRLEAGTLADNIASQRVLEKNGFERIGLARRYLLIAGDWRDHVLFQRTAD